MHEQDLKRLQREHDIAAALRGPDYTQREEAIRKIKAEMTSRDRSAIEAHARERAGYYENNPPRGEFGRPLPFRDPPGYRVR